MPFFDFSDVFAGMCLIVMVPQGMKHLIKQRTAHLYKPIAAPCLPHNIFTGYDISGRVRNRKVKRIKPVISPVTQVKYVT